jgi:hypothetical protein
MDVMTEECNHKRWYGGWQRGIGCLDCEQVRLIDEDGKLGPWQEPEPVDLEDLRYSGAK